jgi:hypothetical protein
MMILQFGNSVEMEVTLSVSSAYYQLMEVIIDNNHLKVEGNWKKL